MTIKIEINRNEAAVIARALMSINPLYSHPLTPEEFQSLKDRVTCE